MFSRFSHNILRNSGQKIQQYAVHLVDLPTGAARDAYLSISKWRQDERTQMIVAMDEMIEEARRVAKSKRIRASERIRWTRLAGQLIWYKDSILKNKT